MCIRDSNIRGMIKDIKAEMNRRGEPPSIKIFLVLIYFGWENNSMHKEECKSFIQNLININNQLDDYFNTLDKFYVEFTDKRYESFLNLDKEKQLAIINKYRNFNYSRIQYLFIKRKMNRLGFGMECTGCKRLACTCFQNHFAFLNF